MSLRTHGHATFLPSTYADQMRRLVPDVPTDLSVFGAYNVEIGEWTQTELAQKIPYQRVLFLRSPCVRRTPGLEQSLYIIMDSTLSSDANPLGWVRVMTRCCFERVIRRISACHRAGLYPASTRSSNPLMRALLFSVASAIK